MSGHAEQRFRALARLRDSEDYAAILASRRSIRGRYFQVFHRAGPFPWARLGIISGKRFARRAVDRNLVRRVSRECFRLMKSSLAGRDIVVRLLAPVTRSERRALREELASLLTKLAG